jgi:hypothetical protein
MISSTRARRIPRQPWHAQFRSGTTLAPTKIGNVRIFKSDKPGRPVLKRRDRQPAKDPTIYPSFRVPRLLLDLDAETSSPYVREATKEDEEQQRMAWGRSRVEAVSGRMDAFQNELAETRKVVAEREKGGFSPWNVLGRDLLSVALFRAPGAAATEMLRQSQVLAAKVTDARAAQEQAVGGVDDAVEKVLKWNAIPGRIVWDDEETFRFLLHAMERSSKGVFGEDASPAFDDAIKACRNVSEVGRLLTTVLDHEHGHRLVLQCGNVVVKRLRALAAAKTPTGSPMVDILRLINNVTIRMEKQHGNPGDDLCLYGLHASARLLQLSALARYTELYLTRDLLRGGEGRAARSVIGVFNRLDKPELWGKLDRPHWFQLLTGSGATLADSAGHESRALRSAIGAAPEYFGPYSQYITMLGELGGLRSLWHEWHASTGNREPPGYEADNKKKVRHFANALQRTLLQLRLRGISKQRAERLYEEATGVYEHDISLDMLAVMDMAKTSPIPHRRAAAEDEYTLNVKQFITAAESALSMNNAAEALAQLRVLVTGNVPAFQDRLMFTTG